MIMPTLCTGTCPPSNWQGALHCIGQNVFGSGKDQAAAVRRAIILHSGVHKMCPYYRSPGGSNRCFGADNAYIVDDATNCDAPRGGKHRCTRTADLGYCQELCSAAGSACTGFDLNPSGCFFHAGHLTTKSSPTNACYIKTEPSTAPLTLLGVMRTAEPGSYLGAGSDARDVVFDPTEFGLCKLTGGGKQIVRAGSCFFFYKKETNKD